jgi:pyrimidine-nucleoside phosphorylase
VVLEVRAPAAGYVARLGAIRVGSAALHLGAGRRTKDDEIDHAVGVVCRAKRGDRVEPGEVLAEIHARDGAAAAEAAVDVLAAYELAPGAPERRPVLLETVG